MQKVNPTVFLLYGYFADRLPVGGMEVILPRLVVRVTGLGICVAGMRTGFDKRHDRKCTDKRYGQYLNYKSEHRTIS